MSAPNPVHHVRWLLVACGLALLSGCGLPEAKGIAQETQAILFDSEGQLDIRRSSSSSRGGRSSVAAWYTVRFKSPQATAPRLEWHTALSLIHI